MLFRSDQQHTLLCFLFVLEQTPMTLTDLAKATGISLSTVSREVGRLEESGIVSIQTIGRAKLARPNWTSPFARPLQMLLTQTCGPLCELRVLHTLPGVREVWLFGSWAERYQGTPGPYPNDVDVAVIGTNVDLLAVHQACAQATRTLQRLTGGAPLDINPVIFPTDEWQHPTEGTLAAHLREEPGKLVQVITPIVFVATEPTLSAPTPTITAAIA